MSKPSITGKKPRAPRPAPPKGYTAEMPKPVAAASSSSLKAKSKKHKAPEEGGSSKRRKAKYEEDESMLDLEAGVNTAFTVMDSQLLADHLAQKTKRFGTDLSPVELSDLYISANAIKDSTSFAKTRILDNLPEYLETFVDDPKKLREAPPKNGAPHTIIVTGAGLRAANIARTVRQIEKKGSTVAKLFAKHIKLEEAVSFLKNTKSGLAVGTPARLMDLLDNGALSVDHLQRIVVDASHIDQKKRGVMDMSETMLPLAKWLTRKEFKERYADEDKHLDLLFY